MALHPQRKGCLNRQVGTDSNDPAEPLSTLNERMEAKSMDRQPVVRAAGQGRTIAAVGDLYRFLARGSETEGKYCLMEALVGPGGGPPPHVHTHEEEGFFILDGEVTFRIGDAVRVLKAGEFANAPIGVPHSFRNESQKPARMLITVAPAGFENMLEEIGKPVEDGATTFVPPSDAEIQKLLIVAPQYGIEILA